MVQNHTADIKHVTWSLLILPSLPLFPKTKWKNILCGLAVNLDADFSGSYLSVIEDKTTSTFSGFELAFGTTKPSKVVQTHGDWTIVWNVTARALCFVYPHCAEEIELYSQYIIQFFGAFGSSESSCVINLNKAIHRHIGEVWNLKLCDFGHFRHLEVQYLQSTGLSTVLGNTIYKEKMHPCRSTEPCQQWNSGFCHC